MVPVRCFTCGKPLGHLLEPLRRRLEAGEPPERALEGLGVRRYCCRRTLIGHVGWLDQVLAFERKAER